MSNDSTNQKSSSYLYKPKEYFRDIFFQLSKHRRNDKFCDITIIVGGKKYRAHKVILTAASPYFEAMFFSGMVESHQETVEVQNIDPEGFEAILSMIYDGQIFISDATVQSILFAASIFQIDHLKKACSDFLIKQLSPQNCLGIKIFAEAHGCYDLMELAHRHALSRFAEVSKSEEFKLLSLEHVTDLLKRDNIRVNDEEDMFDAAMGWINYCTEERAQYVAHLLRLVRLPLLSPEVLADKVKSTPLIQSNLECRDMLDEALISYALPERRRNIPAQKTTVRKCYYGMGIIYAVGGLNSLGGTLSSVERYSYSVQNNTRSFVQQNPTLILIGWSFIFF